PKRSAASFTAFRNQGKESARVPSKSKMASGYGMSGHRGVRAPYLVGARREDTAAGRAPTPAAAPPPRAKAPDALLYLRSPPPHLSKPRRPRAEPLREASLPRRGTSARLASFVHRSAGWRMAGERRGSVRSIARFASAAP